MADHPCKGCDAIPLRCAESSCQVGCFTPSSANPGEAGGGARAGTAPSQTETTVVEAGEAVCLTTFAICGIDEMKQRVNRAVQAMMMSRLVVETVVRGMLAECFQRPLAAVEWIPEGGKRTSLVGLSHGSSSRDSTPGRRNTRTLMPILTPSTSGSADDVGINKNTTRPAVAHLLSRI